MFINIIKKQKIYATYIKSNLGLNQENSLAFWKKAAEQRIAAIKTNKPIPNINEQPATIKSNKHCKLKPRNHIFFLP